MGTGRLRCRACGDQGLDVALSLGKMPLANAFIPPERLDEPEARYPLDFAVCPSCSLAQITESVAPEELFSEYAYFSSYSSTMVEHARAIVERLISERGLGAGSLALEVASNDGYLLQHYVQQGIPVLGIDPARNVVANAAERGVPTVCAFFGPELAEELVQSGKRASVVHANNVLAHVPDVNGFVTAMASVLRDDGFAVIETPYVRHLVERLEFDTIYHEHLFYYSLTSLASILRRGGLTVVNVEQLEIHGGSLRVFAARQGAPDRSVSELLAQEERLGLSGVQYFQGFGSRVEALIARLRVLIESLRSDGRRLAGYGAAAKGTVLLNAIGAEAQALEFVADRSPYKQGRFMPGVHTPIVSPERILQTQPDVVMLLAWNLAEEILAEHREYLGRGGRFLIPIPEPTLVDR